MFEEFEHDIDKDLNKIPNLYLKMLTRSVFIIATEFVHTAWPMLFKN